MTAMSDYLEAKLLDHVFRSVTYVPPTNIYLALYTVAPTDSTPGTEVTGGSYARQIVTFDPAVSGIGQISNAVAATYTNLPACTIVAAAVCDALTGINILMFGALGANRTVAAADSLTVAIGDLDLTFA